MAKDMAEQKPWRFYGREKELNALTTGLEIGTPLGNRNFEAIKVRGRRGVGKTGLLYQMKALAPHDMPIVIHEMDGPEPEVAKRPLMAEIKDHIQTGNRKLLLAATGAVRKNFEERLPERTHLHDDKTWFQMILTELVKAGAVVVLDEFHHAAPLGLHHQVKQVIDTAVGVSRANRKWPGKIVVMGSHQQKVDDMFAPDKPLYGRIDQSYTLEPWRLPTIMTMAAEQGILASPGKFLTLFTAYDGMPRNWDHYCRQNRYAPLHDITDDRAWRQAWLEVERAKLAEPRERWDAKAWIELKGKQRDMLLWIGQNKPRGVQLNKIAPELDLGTTNDKLKFLSHLRTWLGMADQTMLVGESAKPRWAITEMNTLFQINVFREPILRKDDQVSGSPATITSGPEEGKKSLKYMEALEGQGLERLATDWLATQEGVTWHGCRVRHPDVPGDIDAMAARMGTGPKNLWLGSCKRNPAEHDPVATTDHQDRFMAALLASEGRHGRETSAAMMKGAKRTQVLFSPTFSPALRQAYKEQGFEPVDIQDMARSFGLDPSPRLEVTLPEND